MTILKKPTEGVFLPRVITSALLTLIVVPSTPAFADVVELEEVVPEASFVDDLGADSLDLVELIMSMEEEFDIDISDEDAEKMATVKDAIAYIDEH